MAQWYSVATPGETERLVGAWADAPIENEEWCGFILEVAREQVLDYAPASVPATFDPVLLEFDLGWTLGLSREGDVVTATVTPQPGTYPDVPISIPAGFDPHGTSYSYQTGTASSGFWLAVNDGVDGLPDGFAIVANGSTTGPWEPLTAQWLGDLANGDGVPTRYVVAQLQQATNLWNAGRVSGSGDVGVDQFTYTPRPLDKTIKGIIRPQTGRPRVR